MPNVNTISCTIKQVNVYFIVSAARYKGLLMARFKGCPRCGKKMPLEIKGQCEECKKAKYQYMKNLPGLKRKKVQAVYNKDQWRSTRYEVIKRAKGMCEVCYSKGVRKPGNEVHHIIKVSHGDSSTNYDMNNLVYVCTKCHRAIEGMNHEQLLRHLGG